jgi:hypothetical protein
MYKLLLLPLCLLLASPAQAGSTMRCGSNLVSLDDLASEVEGKCGKPAHREQLGYRERVDYYGQVSEIVIEEWVYGPRNGMYYFLRLEGNRLTRIESRRNN